MRSIMMGVIFLAVFFMIAIIISLALYLLESFGLYTLAKRKNLEYPWLAWLPIVKNYLLGELTGNEMWGLDGSKWILVFAPIVMIALSLTYFGFFLSLVLSLAFTVYYFMVLFKLFKEYQPKSADLFIITSILFPVLIPVYLFVIRNKNSEQLSESDKLYEKVYREEDKIEDKKDQTIEISNPVYQSVRDKLEEVNNIEINSVSNLEAEVYESEIDIINNKLENYINLIDIEKPILEIKDGYPVDEENKIELVLEPEIEIDINEIEND